MKRSLCRLTVLLLLACAPASAQTRPYTPQPGSPERKAIMDTLRPLVERDLGQPVAFKVSRLKVKDGWAFMIVTPQRPDGGPIDYARTPYAREHAEGMMSDLVIALMRMQGGSWHVVEYALGPTDVVYEDWPRRHQAPRAIFK